VLTAAEGSVICDEVNSFALSLIALPYNPSERFFASWIKNRRALN